MSVNLLERLTNQLNTLVPMVELSGRDSFNLINKDEYWFSSLEDPYYEYQQNVYYSVILLGYSFWECFLADLVRMIINKYPKMLSGNNNTREDKKVNYSDIFTCQENSISLIDFLIDREIRKIFNKSMKDIINFFNTKLNIEFQKENECIEISLMRNCIIHNQGIISKDLELHNSTFKIGEKLFYNTGDVHILGILKRAVAYSLFMQAIDRYKIYN